MENDEKLVIFDKYSNAVDANIVMGALQSSGIPAGVIGDSTANAIWMAPISVVVFRRDLEQAIMALYDGEMKFEDYEEEMSREQFDNMQACNKAFAAIALKCHPEIDKHRRDLFSQAKVALERGDLATLNAMGNAL